MAEEKSKGKDADAGKGAADPTKAATVGSKKKLFIIVGILTADLLLMGGVAYFIVSRLKSPNPAVEAQKNRESEERKRREEQTRIGMTLPKPLVFTVNIGQPGAEHYLKCSVQLEWEATGPESAKAEKGGGEGKEEGGGAGDALGADIQKRMPKISDIIINILTSQPYQEMLVPAGKQKMKESIVSEVNAILPEEHGRLKNDFFTDFIVQ